MRDLGPLVGGFCVKSQRAHVYKIPKTYQKMLIPRKKTFSFSRNIVRRTSISVAIQSLAGFRAWPLAEPSRAHAALDEERLDAEAVKKIID